MSIFSWSDSNVHGLHCISQTVVVRSCETNVKIRKPENLYVSWSCRFTPQWAQWSISSRTMQTVRRVLSAERINQDQPVGESDCGSIRIYYKEEFKKQIEIDYLLSELPYQGQPLFQTHSIHLLMSRFSFAYKRGWVFSQFCLYCYLQHTGNCSNSFF